MMVGTEMCFLIDLISLGTEKNCVKFFSGEHVNLLVFIFSMSHFIEVLLRKKVTHGRKEFLKFAIFCFLSRTKNKDVVVVKKKLFVVEVDRARVFVSPSFAQALKVEPE